MRRFPRPPLGAPIRQDQQDTATRLANLAAFLREHAPLWAQSEEPAGAEWGRGHPELVTWLTERAQRPLGDDDPLSLEPWDADAPVVLHEWQRSADQLTALPALPREELPIPRQYSRHVPARKWGQVTALCRTALTLPAPPQGYVDCCSGKGHLGRTLAVASRLATTCLERDPALCEQANELGARAGAPLEARVCDVLTLDFQKEVSSAHTAVALHACGDLHLAVADALRSRRLGAMVVAPCCYFRTTRLPFRGLSRPGRAGGLKLDRPTLSFSTCGAAVASPRRRERFTQRFAWESGFRHWCQDRGVQPQRFPRATRAELSEDFYTFCRRRAQASGLRVDSRRTLSRYEDAGWYELRYGAALERLRQPFRRALETWLFLDRAAWLAEAGLRVVAGTFCSRRLTPRHLAWLASW